MLFLWILIISSFVLALIKILTSLSLKSNGNVTFDLILFEKEVNGIFSQLMTAFINDDLETVKLVAGEVALAILTNEIKSRRERVTIYI